MKKRKPREKLTAKRIDTLEAEELVRDEVVRGLFVHVGKAEPLVRSFKIQADIQGGPKPISVRMTLGRFPDMTVDQARAEAQRVLSLIKSGVDPRPGAPAVAGAPTVAKLYAEWTADLRARGKADRTIADVEERRDRYLEAWKPLLLTSITRTMAREAHARITRDHGPVVANDTLRNFRAAFNWACKTWDEPLGNNPAEAVTYSPQRARKDVLTFPDLPTWLAKVHALENPLRAVMHELGLYSGLRPGTLVALERSWVNLAAHAIEVPARVMKKRVAFALPLSQHMVSLVRHALMLSENNFPGAPWLFPTRALSDRRVIATQVWREKKLPSETGHILRHMYSVAAARAGVASVDRMLLMAQKVPGIEGVYLAERALFERLLVEQEKVTAYLLQATAPRS